MKRFQFLGVCAVLALAVFFVYWPTRNHDFVTFDDDMYVTNNRNVQSGLNEQSIRWAFTTGYADNWHPVTWLSHTLDCELFGLGPRGPHIENLLFHIANTLLLFAVLKRMTRAVWPSAFVAAVFGLHPLHVESVAWVAERKDVLSTFFWLLTMLAYAWYVEEPKITRYLPVLLSFVLGLMAKPMLVTLPFVLLLLDYWPLERMRFAGASSENISPEENGRETIPQPRFYHLLLEKVPLMALAVASNIVTFMVQRRGGAVMKMEAIDLKSRIGNAIVAYIGYIGKMFWPSKLAVLYLHPGTGLPGVEVLLCGLLLVAASVCFLLLARRHKYLAAGWLWYVGTLVPVIGLVQVGVQSMADRYTYVPSIGLTIIVAWGAVGLLAKWRYRGPILTALAVAAVFAMAVVTSRQLKYWRNSAALFERTLAVTNDNYVMENNYANFLMESGRLDDAVAHYLRSLQLRPGQYVAHYNVGRAYGLQGDIDQAIFHFRETLKIEPDIPEVHDRLGAMLRKKGHLDEAITCYRQAIELDPNYTQARSDLASALLSESRPDEAIDQLNLILQGHPDDAGAHNLLGVALKTKGQMDDAISHYRRAIALKPDFHQAYNNLGNALLALGQVDETIACYRRALEIKPDYAEAQRNLSSVLRSRNNPP